jgi:hypothetical protein
MYLTKDEERVVQESEDVGLQESYKMTLGQVECGLVENKHKDEEFSISVD